MPKPFGRQAMPAPDVGAMTGTTAPPPQTNPLSGFFNQPMTPERQRMVMELVQAGISQAARSDSPIAAFLAPLVGGGIGRGVLRRADEYGQTQRGEANRAALGSLADNPEAMGLISAIENQSASSAARAVAQRRLDQLVAAAYPAPARRGGRRAVAPAQDPGRGPRMFGEINVGGYMYGRTQDGQIRPYLDPEGQMIPMGTGRRQTAAASPAPAQAQSTATPAAPPAQNQQRGVAPAVDPNDPLGILRLPPA